VTWTITNGLGAEHVCTNATEGRQHHDYERNQDASSLSTSKLRIVTECAYHEQAVEAVC